MGKPKTLKTLEDSDIARLKKQKAFLNGFSFAGRPPLKGNERTNLSHIRDIARKEMVDLKFLAEVLPEQQQKQIFNAKTLGPLFRNLLVVLAPDIGKEYIDSTYPLTILSQVKAFWKKLSREEQAEYNKRIARITELCFELFETIGGEINANLLASETYQTLRSTDNERDRIISGINAIYLKGLFSHPNYPYHMDGKDGGKGMR